MYTLCRLILQLEEAVNTKILNHCHPRSIRIKKFHAFCWFSDNMVAGKFYVYTSLSYIPVEVKLSDSGLEVSHFNTTPFSYHKN